MKPLYELTPRQIVKALDEYIVGQKEAKRAVAIALRNRWRRRQVSDEMRDEIIPNNILMIGPTGVGKTEIARRLARLAGAPFIKIEASKFTEVGYVGRDVESMVRDLVDIAVSQVRSEKIKEYEEKAKEHVEERLLDIILPPPRNIKREQEEFEEEDDEDEVDSPIVNLFKSGIFENFSNPPFEDEEDEDDDDDLYVDFDDDDFDDDDDDFDYEESQLRVKFRAEQKAADEARAKAAEEQRQKTREKLRQRLRDGKFDDREVEIEAPERNSGVMQVFGPIGMEEMGVNLQEMFGNMFPSKTRRRRMRLDEARSFLLNEEVEKLLDMDAIISEAIQRTEEMGIIFLDEIDKIAGSESGQGPDVSREGVQRDILPIIEGTRVTTKYGPVNTEHVLVIAAGAFHISRPSDLIPELQGRLPIRVELDSLDTKDFVKILTEPKNSLVKQYTALLQSEKVELALEAAAIRAIAGYASEVNDRTENIGARRLQTVMNYLLEDYLFKIPSRNIKSINITKDFVQERLSDLVEDEDLSRYIL
ncbi:ATP-dependent protease ATPase subunit HslU [bacterium]|nr:ATP-dependent protease ATPase subunit HslU [bacterium]